MESFALVQERILIYSLYVTTGGMVVGANVIVLAVFLTSKQLRSKYVMLIALACADILAGTGTLTIGWERLRNYLSWPNVPQNMTLADCLHRVGPPLEVVGRQLPSTICLVIGIERVIAVFAPIFYRNKLGESVKNRLLLLIFSLIIALLGIFLSYINVVLPDTTRPMHYDCTTLAMYSLNYILLFRLVTVFCQLLGFLFSATAFICARNQTQLSQFGSRQMNAEARRFNTVLALSTFSMLLAGLPALMSFLGLVGLTKLPLQVNNYLAMASNLNSFLNLFIYFIFKPEFRSHIYFCICRNRERTTALVAARIVPSTTNKTEQN